MKQHAVNIDDVVTYVILAFVFIWCVLAQGYGRKIFRTARQYRRAVREVGEDTLDMLARAARDWPPEADVSVPYLPVDIGPFDDINDFDQRKAEGWQ